MGTISQIEGLLYRQMQDVFMLNNYDHKNSNIQIRNLNVSIDKNHILKNINVDIPDNKITCIIGPSGCGKSTLLKSINRLIDDVEKVDRKSVV